MKEIIIQNFSKSSLQNSISQNRVVVGFVPNYVDLASETDDTNFKTKVNPPYPLVLAPSFTSVATHGTFRIVAMTENVRTALASAAKVFYIRNDYKMFSDDPSQTNYGVGAAVTGSDGADVVVYQANIFTSFLTHAKVRFHDGASTWADHSGSPTNFSTTKMKLLRFFRNTLLVSDSDKIYSLNTAGAGTQVFDLDVAGISPDIIDYNNYGDQYVVIFFELGATPPLYSKTDWILWNGVDANYEFRKHVRGKYKCCINKDNNLFVFTQHGTTVICYVFTGTDFQEVGKIKNLVISEETPNPKMRVSIEQDFFVLTATSPGNVTNTTPFYWNPLTGENFFLGEQSDDILGILIGQNSSASYLRYISSASSTVSNLHKVTLEGTVRIDAATYKSGVIPIPEGRAKITRTILEYSSNPPTSSDVVAVTLNTKDQIVSETITSNVGTIKNSTDNSIYATVGSQRAIMGEFHPLCTEFDLQLSLSKSTSTYWPIFRRVRIQYEPIIEKQ